MVIIILFKISICPQGFNLFSLALNVFSYSSKFTDYPLIKEDVECKSGDELLGNVKDVFACRNLCDKKSGCFFYVYGKGSKEGKCYWEKAKRPTTVDKTKICSEGWENDKFDFYQALSRSITSKFYQNFHIFL